MRRANVELHGTLKKARKEVHCTRSKLLEVATKEDEKLKIAIERLKVSTFYIFTFIIVVNIVFVAGQVCS
jgi:hypothetical protein